MSPAQRRIGTSGLTASVVGLGTNTFGRQVSPTRDVAGTTAVVDAAIEHGITFFDTADIYGSYPGQSEEFLGQALAGRRDDVVIATKFGMDMSGANGADFDARGSRRYIVRAAEASLRRLQTDWIDLYQHHTPDPLTPIDETLGALDDLVRSGKVRYVGHSNRSGWQIAQAEYVARELGATRFVSSQNHYNLLDRRAEQEVMVAAREFGLGVLPYFPLANGLLTGDFRRDQRPTADTRLGSTKVHLWESAPWDQLEALEAVASQAGLTLLQLAFSWLASQSPVSSIIAGATRPSQVAANAASVVPLDDDVLAAIDGIFPPPGKVALF